jgi:hypothetical protein
MQLLVYFKYVFLKTWHASLLPYEDSFIYCYESMIELFLKELLPFFAIRIFHQKVVHASPLSYIVAISFIGGGNQGTRRKPQTMRPVASY